MPIASSGSFTQEHPCGSGCSRPLRALLPLLFIAVVAAPAAYASPAGAPVAPPASSASPAEAPVAPPAASAWGIFDKLAGQELKSGDGGYTLRFSWVRPGEELQQEWIHPSSGKVVGTAVTVRDPATGQLREGKTVAAAAKGYLGSTNADGSVAFLKGKSGYRWQIAADGFVERVDLKLAGSEVVAKPAPSYARWAMPVVEPAPRVVPGVAVALARPSGSVAPTPQVIAGPSRVTELSLGISAPGKLAADAEVDAEGRPYRCYSFNAAAGTAVKATLSSKEFQPLVRLARGSLCGSARVSREAESQRGAAELSEVIAAGGSYVLLVGSRTPGATGRFQLSLDATEPPMAADDLPDPAAAGAARVASTGGGARAAAPSSRVAAMQAQAAFYQADIDRRAEEARIRREQEAEAARIAAAEERAAQERRAATFMAVMNGVMQVGAAYLEAKNGGSGGGGMGNGLSGVAGQAMAAAKPNVIDGGACSKVTASNYRTEALVKDGDTQLRTMCGAAHEYYNVYLNALKQGYSPADADRSYQAHVQAATTAASYAQTHRAN